eukprot:6454925-Prymnesium_polylepis.1
MLLTNATNATATTGRSGGRAEAWRPTGTSLTSREQHLVPRSKSVHAGKILMSAAFDQLDIVADGRW